GRQVRQYTGHVNPIRSLAFDAAGRLLASAAEDQTVSVWTLTDLGETLGRHGMLAGFVVKVREGPGGGLVVARRDPAALREANRKELERQGVSDGEPVRGLVVGGEVRPLATPHAFYDGLWQLAPGQKVTLRIGKRDVPLRLDQGADERKPLFTLFLTRGGKPEERQWLGWSPNGFYDAGDRGPRAARHVGGHRNTGQ